MATACIVDIKSVVGQLIIDRTYEYINEYQVHNMYILPIINKIVSRF